MHRRFRAKKNSNLVRKKKKKEDSVARKSFRRQPPPWAKGEKASRGRRAYSLGLLPGGAGREKTHNDSTKGKGSKGEPSAARENAVRKCSPAGEGGGEERTPRCTITARLGGERAESGIPREKGIVYIRGGKKKGTAQKLFLWYPAHARSQLGREARPRGALQSKERGLRSGVGLKRRES